MIDLDTRPTGRIRFHPRGQSGFETARVDIYAVKHKPARADPQSEYGSCPEMHQIRTRRRRNGTDEFLFENEASRARVRGRFRATCRNGSSRSWLDDCDRSLSAFFLRETAASFLGARGRPGNPPPNPPAADSAGPTRGRIIGRASAQRRNSPTPGGVAGPGGIAEAASPPPWWRAAGCTAASNLGSSPENACRAWGSTRSWPLEYGPASPGWGRRDRNFAGAANLKKLEVDGRPCFDLRLVLRLARLSRGGGGGGGGDLHCPAERLPLRSCAVLGARIRPWNPRGVSGPGLSERPPSGHGHLAASVVLGAATLLAP